MPNQKKPKNTPTAVAWRCTHKQLKNITRGGFLADSRNLPFSFWALVSESPVNRAQPPWHSAVTHESPLGNRELRLKKLWQVVIHPVCRLFVSKGDLKHGKVGVMLADNLHSHRQLVFVEPDGDTDNRQTR